MTTEPEKTESSLEEQLVAYLDGEMDAESVRRIEERLATEPEVRDAINRLERTWDMLDELGSTPVGESFTRTTLEMVTVAAEADIQQAIAEVPLRRRRRRWLLGVVVLLTAAAGFFAAYTALPNSNRQLLQDLPLLENLEEYRQVDDIDFLRLMKEKGLSPLLATAETPAKEHPLSENMSTAEKTKWVETISPSEKEDLLRKKEIFDKLSIAEQDRLRKLHREVQKDKDAAELNRIMHDYYEWWKNNLPPYFRNELSSLSSPQERVKRIELYKQEELKRNPAKFLTERDTTELQDWLTGYIKKFETNHRESLSPSERKKWDALNDMQRRREIAGFLFWRRGQGAGIRTLPLPEDLAELRAKLSPEARQLLEDKPPEEQWKTIQSWLPMIARQQFAARMGRRPSSLVEENEIAQFFESISNEERMRLLDLSPEDMQHELQRMYLSRKKPMEPFIGRPDGPPGGGPRGPRGNPDRNPPN
jgi:hypothetical protein